MPPVSRVLRKASSALGMQREGPTSLDDLNPNDPSKALGALTERTIKRHNKFYLPVEIEAINSLTGTELIDQAKSTATRGFADEAGRTERDMKRFGVNQTALQRREGSIDTGTRKALNFDATVNNSRLDQYERNTSLRNELINVGRDVASSSNQALGAAATNQTNRDNANDAAKAAKKAQTTSMVGSLASAALMAVIML